MVLFVFVFLIAGLFLYLSGCAFSEKEAKMGLAFLLIGAILLLIASLLIAPANFKYIKRALNQEYEQEVIERQTHGFVFCFIISVFLITLSGVALTLDEPQLLVHSLIGVILFLINIFAFVPAVLRLLQ